MMFFKEGHIQFNSNADGLEIFMWGNFVPGTLDTCLQKDVFSGQENEVISRLLLISRETQHVLVFRLLALHWSSGFMGLVMSKRKIRQCKWA
nr:AP-5 complex subunit beta-1 [Tanacetum cinerariifolium]